MTQNIRIAARTLVIVLLATVLSACSAPAMLAASLIPDGTANALLANLEKMPEENRKRIAALESAGKFDDLAAFANQNIAKDASNANWWFVLGYARARLSQYTEAAEGFSHAVQLEPDNMDAWNFLAQSYRASGDSRRAINALNNALNVTRAAPATLYLLGSSYADVNLYSEAAAAYREAVTLEPEFAVAWFALARTYTRLGRADDALDARERLQKIDPKLAAKLGE